GEDPLELSRPHHLSLREPGVVADAEHRGHTFGLAEDPLHALGCEALRLLLERELPPLVAVTGLDAGGDVLHVLGGVRVRGYFDVFAVELPVPDRDRAAERVELRPGVLDVVLALDRRARELKDRRQNVADRHAVDAGPPKLGRRPREAVLYRGGNLVAERWGHPRESGTANVRVPTSPPGSCVAKRRHVRIAARAYANTSVTRLTVNPSGPSRVRTAPDRIAPTAFAALHASAKTALAPARSAGVNDDSWKAFTVPLAPNIRKCRVASAPTAMGSAPVKAATSAKGSESVSTRTIDGIAPRRAATNRPWRSAPMLPATARMPSSRPRAENGTP